MFFVNRLSVFERLCLHSLRRGFVPWIHAAVLSGRQVFYVQKMREKLPRPSLTKMIVRLCEERLVMSFRTLLIVRTLVSITAVSTGTVSLQVPCHGALTATTESSQSDVAQISLREIITIMTIIMLDNPPNLSEQSAGRWIHSVEVCARI